MPSLENRKRYWRSIEDLEGRPEFDEFLSREYPEQVGMLSDPLSRRRFMQLMGASLSLSGVAGCRWEEDSIVPLSRRPEGYIPGVEKVFATAMELGGVAQPLLARAYDGRPVKLEPNNEHPQGAKGTSALAQASVLGLYDPDRSQAMSRAKLASPTPGDLSAFLEGLRGKSGLRVLSEATSSVTVAALRANLLKIFPGAKWHEYEPLSRDNEREGTRLAFGVPQRVHYKLDNAVTNGRARVVACFDADLLDGHPDGARLSRELTAAREPGRAVQRRSRIYAAESAFTTLGAMADHRIPVPGRFIVGLLHQLEASLKNNAAPGGSDRYATFLRALYGDLVSAKGRSAVIVGAGQTAEAHATAARINDLLEHRQDGCLHRQSRPARPTHFQDIAGLAKDMKAGVVDTLLILGGNPVYNAPRDFGFAAGLANVKNSLHLSLYQDETSAACKWHVPAKHYLESWGDARSYDGTISLIQPLIEPLYAHSKSAIELLAELAGQAGKPVRELVRDAIGAAGGSGVATEPQWQQVLHDGFVTKTALPAAGWDPRSVTRGSESQREGRAANRERQIGSRFHQGGRLRRPLCEQRMAARASRLHDQTHLGQRGGHESAHRVSAQRRYRRPRQARRGRKRDGAPGLRATRSCAWDRCGRVGIRPIARRAGGWVQPTIRRSSGARRISNSGSGAPYMLGGATVTSTGKKYPLASTQSHWIIDETGAKAREKRATHNLIYSNTQEGYAKDPDFVTKHAEIDSVKALIQTKTAFEVNRSLWQEHAYETNKWGQPIYKWGMAIDLNKCTGCNACVVACQAENNIAVVGKDEVRKNREMHWLRIDRYFVGDPNQPQVAHQPVACMQCENAPCEQVCPVGATAHSTEGLNDMAYNRCVGTRYCANNCPYKVRRFNYHYLWKELDEPQNASRKLAFNPEVTVRSRGVMEKCSFCVQRIQNHRIKARNARRRLKDGEFTTACAQACPATPSPSAT